MLGLEPVERGRGELVDPVAELGKGRHHPQIGAEAADRPRCGSGIVEPTRT
jgi:hypothetical protein